ncbi:MAG: SDR family oxidoreductase [Bacteroidota bacterium]
MPLHILITGASTGIGAATALEMAPGNHVYIHYHSSEAGAQEVAAEVEKRGGKASLLKANLMVEAGCHELVKELASVTDRLDVLVNNAGGLVKRHPIPGLEWSLMEQIFGLNVFSTMLLTDLCLPLLRASASPSIVNVTSVAMRSGAPTATIYGAAKSAIDSFTRGTARELAPQVRVNAIAPGVIETPFHDKYSTDERMQQFRDAAPLKRNGVSQHISSAVRLLIENDFITGETIDINGGLFMR